MFCRILSPGHLKINTIYRVPWVTMSSLSAKKKNYTQTRKRQTGFSLDKMPLKITLILYKRTDNIIWIVLRPED